MISNSTGYSLAWDEVRDGTPHVFFKVANAWLDGKVHTVMLSAVEESTKAPALATIDADALGAAWEVERGANRHVQLNTFDPMGSPLGENIEVQGHDGRAQTPVIALGRDAMGLATVSERGISFHHIPLGPCRPPR